MPATLKLLETFGDDVNVIFVEAQGSGDEASERFVLAKKWLNPRAIWTTEAPFETGSGSLPHTTVLGIDGEVIFNGKPGPEIEESVAEQVKLAKKGPKGLAAPLQKAWVDFEKGSYAAALKALEQVPEGADKAAAGKLATTLTARLQAKVARANWLGANADFEAADKLVAQLQAGVKGLEAFEPKVAEVATALSAKETATEREAAKALDRVKKKMAKDGPDEGARKSLNGVSEKFPNTNAAKIAAHWVKLFGG